MTMCLLSCDTKPSGSSRPCIVCGLADMFPFFFFFFYNQDSEVLVSQLSHLCVVAVVQSRHSSVFLTDHTHKAALVWRPIAVISPFQSVSTTAERICLITMAMW